MQYLIAFYEDPNDFAARARDDEAFWRGWREFFAAIDAEGIRVFGAPLEDADRAATTRNGAEGRIVHDGPYAETKEQLGGFVVIDVPTLDAALSWAERCPAARTGAVEVRPVLEPADAGVEPCAGNAESVSGGFMLSIYESAAAFANRQGPEAERYWREWTAFGKALDDAGIARKGAALRGPETATVVRTHDEGRIVQDGPYADTKEQLGGFIIVDVASLDEALNWAARSPAAFSGAVEVRPVLKIGARA
jgi:hypothetical protein